MSLAKLEPIVEEGENMSKASTLGKGKRFFKRRKKLPRQAKPSVNPLKKLQLSIFNNRYIPIDPNPDKAHRLVPKKPMDYNAFAKHMVLIRKYEVMLKMEFQVRKRAILRAF